MNSSNHEQAAKTRRSPSAECLIGETSVRYHLAVFVVCVALGQAKSEQGLAEQLQKSNAAVVPADSEKGKQMAQMVSKALRARRDDANLVESKTWRLRVHNRASWEEYRDERIGRLRRSLGQYPQPPSDL